MKKWNMLLLAMLLACMPAAGFAQELPDLFTAVYEGVGEGLAEAAALLEEQAQGETEEAPVLPAMQESGELTLTIEPAADRIEEGKTLRVTVNAGNPMPREMPVAFSMKLPEGVTASPDTAWEAVLPAAGDGPSETAFTRELTLEPGGVSMPAQLMVEMSMGTRFYRAGADIALCVPDVTVEASLDGAQDGRLTPGALAVYQIAVRNSGAAPKDVPLALTLPEGVTAEQIPAGFAQAERTIRGTVRAEAAQGETPFEQAIRIPVRIAEDILEGDEDASRLISGVLTADGKRMALPRMQVCGAKISARMIADRMNLEEGEETCLRVVIANSGLAEADVEVSCMLPEGLALIREEEEEATPGEAVLPGGGDQPAMTQGERVLTFDVHMPAAEQGAGGVTAYTKEIEIPVEALQAQEKLSEQLMGAALAWRVDEGDAQLAQAVAMRVYRPAFLGISGDDWSGMFWAAILLMITIACLCAAVRNDKREEDFCCE